MKPESHHIETDLRLKYSSKISDTCEFLSLVGVLLRGWFKYDPDFRLLNQSNEYELIILEEFVYIVAVHSFSQLRISCFHTCNKNQDGSR